ncbi:MAG TPA: chloride channel protein [Armatimonadota bacterium]|jgi:H+/Cl- antiporter ClcA
MRSAKQLSIPVAEARLLFMSVLSAGIGVVCGFVAYGLYHLIGFTTNILYYHRLSWDFVSPRFHHLALWAIPIPAVAGLAIGAMVKYGSRKISGHGIPEAMEAILLNKSRISPRVAILKPVSAALAIGSGGPFGAEGPIIQTGGAIGSLVGQFLHVTPAERKVLLACGAAGGMAATFSTPIAAVILAIELLLFEFKSRSFIPICIASVIATSVRFGLFGTGPMFSVPHHGFGTPSTLPAYMGLSVVAGLAAVVITKALYAAEDLFDRIPLDILWLPAIGGLAVGLIGYMQPRVLGVGYDTITEILDGRLTASVLIALVVAKAAAMCISLGSKTSGGVLAPVLTVGGAIGCLYGFAITHFWPALGLQPGVFALVCMAAVFGASTRATFTSIVFAFELTRDYQAVLPLMLVCVIADAIASSLMEHSIMTEKLVRRGVKVPQEYEADVLMGVNVSDVMSRNVFTVEADEPVTTVIEQVQGRRKDHPAHQAYPILDSDGHLAGIISRSDLIDCPEEDLDRLTVSQVGTPDVIVAHPDEPLHDALAKMLTFDIGHLPVVERDLPKTVVGFLTRSDIFKARHRRMADELHRHRVYNPLPRLLQRDRVKEDDTVDAPR